MYSGRPLLAFTGESGYWAAHDHTPRPHPAPWYANEASACARKRRVPPQGAPGAQRRVADVLREHAGEYGQRQHVDQHHRRSEHAHRARHLARRRCP